ncbi:MAG: SgcJ/EcaC family oxidoreductase [Kibdelosporangium sp.]
MVGKRIAAVVAAAAVATGAATISADATAGTTGDDRAAFERILKQQHDAWFEEDGAKFAATFTKDADLVTFNGDHLTTREGIAKGMQYYFDTYIDHTQLKALDQHVRFVNPSMAVIVRTGCQLEPPSTECRPDSLSRNTNVLVKRNGKWLQESFQNTRVVTLP